VVEKPHKWRWLSLTLFREEGFSLETKKANPLKSARFMCGSTNLMMNLLISYMKIDKK
jgi:hypothetical protein